MLYVSFAEIFVKSQGGFQDAGYAENDAYMYATLCFFGGIAIGKFLDVLVHLLDHTHTHDLPEEQPSPSQARLQPATNAEIELKKSSKAPEEPLPVTPDLHNLDLEQASAANAASHPGLAEMDDRSETSFGEKPRAKSKATVDSADDSQSITSTEAEDPQTQKRLVRMGVMTALAIGIHNFPEGLATFVATLDDPAVGGALAIAIAIHNIPEGLCVSIPIYYATGDRKKAFWWAFLSGISEPIGAGLGWLVLSNVMGDELYGVLFGIVAGMMVNICLHELIPTAFRHDPKDTVVTYGLIGGMAIMAVSLLLFMY